MQAACRNVCIEPVRSLARWKRTTFAYRHFVLGRLFLPIQSIKYYYFKSLVLLILQLLGILIHQGEFPLVMDFSALSTSPTKPANKNESHHHRHQQSPPAKIIKPSNLSQVKYSILFFFFQIHHDRVNLNTQKDNQNNPLKSPI